MTALVSVLRTWKERTPRVQWSDAWRVAGIPLVSMLLFVLAWSRVAASVETSLGRIPGPAAVWEQTGRLLAEHRVERARAAAFHARQDARNAQLHASDGSATPTVMRYTGKPTYIDQIVTSLQTVFTGFTLASLVAIPLGILCGLSPAVNAGVNPFIQIFRRFRRSPGSRS
jgi:nitrate/nitrite transport system permease protein